MATRQGSLGLCIQPVCVTDRCTVIQFIIFVFIDKCPTTIHTPLGSHCRKGYHRLDRSVCTLDGDVCGRYIETAATLFP